ncbi:MAG: hypothetical protein ACI4I9_01870 [Porcipelethomonas sp.]
MNRDYINCGEMPLGLGMALARNLKAMEKFSLMTPEEKKRVIIGCHNVSSKDEMQQYVQNIADRPEIN